MIRKIISIDAEKCNSCGECVTACHEGAIGMENGKAVLLRDDYCDGLGDCLPVCRAGAILIEERDALPYSETAVLANVKSRTFKDVPKNVLKSLSPAVKAPSKRQTKTDKERTSCLGQWPVQIKLMAVTGAFFSDADILIAADCCAYAYGDFHRQLMRGKVTLIGCPKLDGVDYAKKISEILQQHTVRSVTVAQMNLPCCGLDAPVRRAMRMAGKKLPYRVAIITPQGRMVMEEEDPADAGCETI